MVWFGEIERKLAKLSMTTFTYRSSSYLFYATTQRSQPRELLTWRAGLCLPFVIAVVRMVVYIYFITAARNVISSQLGSSCQGRRCGTPKQAAWTLHHVQNHTPLGRSSQPGGPPCWADPLTFGFIADTPSHTS
jgi:hypothetical protein